MSQEKSYPKVSIENLRWRLDPTTLSFETTHDLQPLTEIIGQKRGVEAFRFGINPLFREDFYEIIIIQ